ncbi:hypothetical protein ABEB36_006295 [Hypothenemus hampei]|uniref:Uncharacterized protein n=1 Tax=Hypothenemus hampei TaxID=57062 RepID=A0ABD1EQI2_HYPHA
MSTIFVTQNSSGIVRSSWNKSSSDSSREHQRCRYYYRLESENSSLSDGDTESVSSLQEKETDVAQDTSDTESESPTVITDDEYEVEVQCRSASSSENKLQTSDSEDIILAAATAVICKKNIDNWITDVEYSTSTSSSSNEDNVSSHIDYSTCLLCKRANNSLYPYCEKCYQNRKSTFPPRPRKRLRKKRTSFASKTVLSQDSGVGSSQDMQSIELEQIVEPKPGTSKDTSVQPIINRKRQHSDITQSIVEVKKLKSATVLPQGQPNCSSSSSTSVSIKSTKSEPELCMFCNNAPKDSIFLHGNKAHLCCCYSCAKKTFKSFRRCPICNGVVNKVIKIFSR